VITPTLRDAVPERAALQVAECQSDTKSKKGRIPYDKKLSVELQPTVTGDDPQDTTNCTTF
jgi:hypothetical protein